MKRWEWIKFLGIEPNCAERKVRSAFLIALVFLLVGCNPTTKSTQVVDVTDVGITYATGTGDWQMVDEG
jgi:hypothetical protein